MASISFTSMATRIDIRVINGSVVKRYVLAFAPLTTRGGVVETDGTFPVPMVMEISNSRKVVGWSLGKRLTSTLACDALRMAIWSRRPPPGHLIYCLRIVASSMPVKRSGGY
jgi:hypothetical protein